MLEHPFSVDGFTGLNDRAKWVWLSGAQGNTIFCRLHLGECLFAYSVIIQNVNFIFYAENIPLYQYIAFLCLQRLKPEVQFFYEFDCDEFDTYINFWRPQTSIYSQAMTTLNTQIEVTAH